MEERRGNDVMTVKYRRRPIRLKAQKNREDRAGRRNIKRSMKKKEERKRREKGLYRQATGIEKRQCPR